MTKQYYANRNLNILVGSPKQFSDCETSEDVLSGDEGKGDTVVFKKT